MSRNAQMTLLDRLRRASLLRVVLVIAAILASQSSLACAFEAATGDQGVELAAGVFVDEKARAVASGENPEDGCCSLCFDCAHCGGCHTSAVSPRIGAAHPAFASYAFAKISRVTSAPTRWTPSALLRPPIDAA
jgi:hypothetical protein